MRSSKRLTLYRLTVVHWARMGNIASFSCKDDVITGTGNHVVLGGETADQCEKMDRGLMEPEVTWFGRGNRWRV